MSNQAAWLDGVGKRLRVGEAKTYEVGDNEVAIRNHALAVNPFDWKRQDHGYFNKEYPLVLGCDVSGEIVEVGSNVDRFKIGDRVIGHATSGATGDNKNAGFQLFTVLPTERVAKIPSTVSFEQGVVLPLAISTAADGLYKPQADGYLGLPYPGGDAKSDGDKVVVVYGASSSVGSIAVQLAVASGARVVALASERNFQLVRDAGAVELVDYKDSQAVEKVVAAVEKLGGEFVGVYDAISLEAGSYNITVPILEKLGRGNLATVLPPPKKLPPGSKAGSVFAITSTTDRVWNEFVESALASGELKPVPPPLVIGSGLADVQKGLDENKKGVSAKKVVIKLE